MGEHKRLARHFHDKPCVLLERAHAAGWLDFDTTRITARAACSLPGFLYTGYRPDGRLPAEAVRPTLVLMAWRVFGLRRRVRTALGGA